MLKIIGSKDCCDPQVEFGEYLPLKIFCGDKFFNSKSYWRVGNFQSSLMEIEIDQESLQLMAVSVIISDEVIWGLPEIDFSCAKVDNGWPVIDVKEWPMDGIKDEEISFRIFVDDKNIFIQMCHQKTTSKVISVNNVAFGVDSNNFLIWIMASNLKIENLIEFKNLWSMSS